MISGKMLLVFAFLSVEAFASEHCYKAFNGRVFSIRTIAEQKLECLASVGSEIVPSITKPCDCATSAHDKGMNSFSFLNGVCTIYEAPVPQGLNGDIEIYSADESTGSLTIPDRRTFEMPSQIPFLRHDLDAVIVQWSEYDPCNTILARFESRVTYRDSSRVETNSGTSAYTSLEINGFDVCKADTLEVQAYADDNSEIGGKGVADLKKSDEFGVFFNMGTWNGGSACFFASGENFNDFEMAIDGGCELIKGEVYKQSFLDDFKSLVDGTHNPGWVDLRLFPNGSWIWGNGNTEDATSPNWAPGYPTTDATEACAYYGVAGEEKYKLMNVDCGSSEVAAIQCVKYYG